MVIPSATEREAEPSGEGNVAALPITRRSRPVHTGPVDHFVDTLLGRGANVLPTPFQERFTEEWDDHRTHHRGWQLLWWALCVRATATRIGRELRHAELPRPER